jgi:hypothetical protein
MWMVASKTKSASLLTIFELRFLGGFWIFSTGIVVLCSYICAEFIDGKDGFSGGLSNSAFAEILCEAEVAKSKLRSRVWSRESDQTRVVLWPVSVLLEFIHGYPLSPILVKSLYYIHGKGGVLTSLLCPINRQFARFLMVEISCMCPTHASELRCDWLIRKQLALCFCREIQTAANHRPGEQIWTKVQLPRTGIQMIRVSESSAQRPWFMRMCLCCWI